MSLVVRAQAAAAEERYEEALGLLNQVEPALSWRNWVSHERRERWLRAEVLYALGRYDEARLWYEGFGIDGNFTQAYVAPARFRLGDIYERLGDPEKAALHYRLFIKRWAGCDPELQPYVQHAERALQRLTGEPQR
jgi:tetratricopeptide (TPR) repeat protein